MTAQPVLGKPPALAIRGLRKVYDGKPAVDGLDLDIPEGAFHGLLGPNGAGKTTTIASIVGLVRPTSGSVSVFGHDAWSDAAHARRHVGLAPQEFNFDDFLGLERILAYHAGYYGMPYPKALERARELLRFFDLYDYRQKRTSTLSGGMKRRLLLARALMHQPRMLILDEPTAGVDVELRRSLWEHVRRLNEEEGLTILLTTHYLEEAEALCKQVTVIDRGQVIEQGHPDELRERYGSRRVRVLADDLPPAFQADALGFARNDRGAWIREGPDAIAHLPAMLRAIEAAGGTVQDVQTEQSRLEDVFVRLTRRDRPRDGTDGVGDGPGKPDDEEDQP
jgi:ABC-2 type transport system ATP-binding protein